MNHLGLQGDLQACSQRAAARLLIQSCRTHFNKCKRSSNTQSVTRHSLITYLRILRYRKATITEMASMHIVFLYQETLLYIFTPYSSYLYRSFSFATVIGNMHPCIFTWTWRLLLAEEKETKTGVNLRVRCSSGPRFAPVNCRSAADWRPGPVSSPAEPPSNNRSNRRYRATHKTSINATNA